MHNITDDMLPGSDLPPLDDLTRPDIESNRELADQVKRLAKSLEVRRGPSPLHIFFDDQNPAGPLTWLSERVPIGVVWLIGGITADLTVAGTFKVTLETADSGLGVMYGVVPVGGGHFPTPNLYLSSGQRFAVTATGQVGSPMHVAILGEIHAQ